MGTGGSRWGAGRPAQHIKAEDVQQLPIGLCTLRNRIYGASARVISWTWRGKPWGSLGVHPSSDEITLSFRTVPSTGNPSRERMQTVFIATTHCNFGGTREWFICPVCGRQCGKLYLRWDRFACRRCQFVRYASQSGDALDRLCVRAHKARARCQGPKPKGMRWATYNALRERAFDLEDAAHVAVVRRYGDPFES